MQKNKKRYLLFGLFIVLLLVVCYANYRINNGPIVKNEEAVAEGEEASEAANTQSEGDDYYAVFKQDRDSVRAKEIEVLDSIVLNEASTKDAKAKAQDQKLELIAAMEKEVTVEGLLKAKGFNNVAVTVHKGSVNVVVDATQLSDTDVAQILDIARRETKEKVENIKVMPRG